LIFQTEIWCVIKLGSAEQNPLQASGMNTAMMDTAWEISDEALAKAAQSGDREAFAVLVARHRDVVFAYAFARLQTREEAEDVAQEAFVRAYQALPRYRPNHAWGAYLMRTLRNLCHDALRRRRVRKTVAPRAESPDLSLTPEHRLLTDWERDKLRNAVGGLPDLYRVPLLMRYGAGRTYKEIAAAVGVPESTVAGRLAGALKLLRRTMEGESR
jgi:RNA polymerase sigma-70 factor (ECF subfamily)